jgi:PKD repeat protein
MLAFVAMLVLAAALAPRAGAVVVHLGHGQIAGVMPINGESPAAIPGSVAGSSSLAPSQLSSNGNADYHRGPVLHGETPYLIFWDPTNEFTSDEKALFERYFADAATDSGLSSDVYAVDRQYTDATGFADYHQVWSAAHAITDTHAYPASMSPCVNNSAFRETACLLDSQLHAEVARLISASGLPTGTSGNAPIYFVVTPPDVNSCLDSGSGCADNAFCAYHSDFIHNGNEVLYANIPTLLAQNEPKGCQADGNSAVQQPNGNLMTEIAIDGASHEYNETITDPLGTGWWDSATGNELADTCAFEGPVDPAKGSNPDAYSPTLGGSASAGTLFDQLINGDQYYTQSEWSNGDVNCETQTSHSATGPIAAISGPSFASQGTTQVFDPSASSNPNGYTSTTWDFGDDSVSFARSSPTSISHTFSTGGAHTVKLTLVDRFGNLSSVSHVVNVPQAVFSSTTAQPVAASPVSFDGSGSSAPGSSVSSFSWNFGDGATGSGATAIHAYSAAGTYDVALTITDALGDQDTVFQPVTVSQPVKTVASVPSAVISLASPYAVAGVPVSLNASRSTDSGSTISDERWDFGDGTTGSGASLSHRFTRIGTFPITLTVTDASAATSSTTMNLIVTSPEITAVKVRPGKKVENLKVAVTGPGKLTVGSKTVTASGPGTFTLSVKLSAAQRARLQRHHPVTLRVKVKFAPAFGAASIKWVTITIKG